MCALPVHTFTCPPLPNIDRHDSGPGWGTNVLSARSPQITASSWMENMAQILVLIQWAWPLLDMARLTPLTCVLQKKVRCNKRRCTLQRTNNSRVARSHKRVRSHFLFRVVLSGGRVLLYTRVS